MFVAIGALALAGLHWLYVGASVGTGYAARVVCSLVFNSGQHPDSVFRNYVEYEIWPLGPLVSLDVDSDARAVDAATLGLLRARAIYREGLGCTLLAGADEDVLRAVDVPGGIRTSPPIDVPWPHGSAGPESLPPPDVTRALERAFAEPSDAGDAPRRQTTAIAVIHEGRLVAERYAEGYGPTTPMLSWSMAKSVLAALVGIAVADGRLLLEAPAPVMEWREAGDPRAAITLDQLMRMSSGLAFDETYGATNDVSRMLFTRADTGAFAAAMPLAHPPDTVWSYSSGTSNLVARVLRDLFGGDLALLAEFARARLFDSLAMTTAFCEPDASGSFTASSFCFASARDWARFGQLHLQDGLWGGRRILPEGWVSYVTTPTSAAPDGVFGAHWWLNAGDPRQPERRTWPSLPREIYAARGHSGQYVVVVPSRQLVVVRLGLAHDESEKLHGIVPLLETLLDVYRPAKHDADTRP